MKIGILSMCMILCFEHHQRYIFNDIFGRIKFKTRHHTHSQIAFPTLIYCGFPSCLSLAVDCAVLLHVTPGITYHKRGGEMYFSDMSDSIEGMVVCSCKSW